MSNGQNDPPTEITKSIVRDAAQAVQVVANAEQVAQLAVRSAEHAAQSVMDVAGRAAKTVIMDATQDAKAVVLHAATAAQSTIQGAAQEAKTVMAMAAQEAQTVLRVAQAGQEQRLAFLERALSKITDALDKLSALDAVMVSVKSDVIDHETRVRTIEGEMPVLKLIRNWVIAGVLGVWALAGSAALAFVFSRFGA